MSEIIAIDGKIKCIITGKLRKETPEEFVRQEFINTILNIYNYPKDHIEIEFPIKIGSKTKYIDIAIFNSKSKSQENIYVAIETKKKKETEGKEQLLSYVSATTANFGIWTNGEKIKYILKIAATPNKINEIPDIPKYRETLDSIGHYNKKDLVKSTDLKGVFAKCNNYFYVNQGLTPDKRFREILKILFCKIEDEKNIEKEECNFYVTVEEKKTKKSLNFFKGRINELFEIVKSRFSRDDIFESNEKIILNERCLTFAVAEFQKYSLLETDIDIKGVAFEEFVGANLRGEHGEFFTPREVVKMCVEMISPELNEKICDPACGSGGFLVMALKMMTSKIEKISKGKKSMQAVSDYADENILGIDFNPDLAKVSKMNMVLNDDGHTGIFHYDALTSIENWPEKLKERVDKDSIDIILMNPPFGKKCVIDDTSILRNYELGHKWKKENGKYTKTNTVSETRTPDILFVEQALNLLKPGGRAAIVLPDGIIGNDGFEFARQYILERSHLLAVIDCPVETFLPSVDTKTSVLIIKKKSKNSNKKYDTFMGIGKYCGHDRRGKTLFERDKNGEIILDNNNVPKIKNDFFKISKEFIKYAKTNNILSKK